MAAFPEENPCPPGDQTRAGLFRKMRCRFKFTSNADCSNFRKNCASFAAKVEKRLEVSPTGVSTLAARVLPNAANNGRGGFWGWVMRFLLRMAFWLTVILVMLPSGGWQPTPKVNVSA